jgi:hypothetical protein
VGEGARHEARDVRHGGRRVRPVLWREARGAGAWDTRPGASVPSFGTRCGAGAFIPSKKDRCPEGIVLDPLYARI